MRLLCKRSFCSGTYVTVNNIYKLGKPQKDEESDAIYYHINYDSPIGKQRIYKPWMDNNSSYFELLPDVLNTNTKVL